MTIKMLIVDDEPIISEGLRTTIPWLEFGIEVAGVAHGGTEALEIIQTQEIDIVLTDVMMPEMDGIELVKTLYEKNDNVQTIVISGYNEFDYAREALRYGVKDYLLKPVDIDELTTIVQKLRDTILEKKKKNENERNEEMKQWLSHRLLKTPIFHKIDSKEIFNTDTYCLIVSEMKNMVPLMDEESSSNLNDIRYKWESVLQDHFKHSGHDVVSIFTHSNLLATLVSGNGVSVQEVRETLNNIDSLELIFGVSETFKNLDSIKEQYEEAKQLLSFKEWANTKVLDKTVRFEDNHVDRSFETTISEQIVQSLLQQNEENMEQSINTLFNEFKNNRCPLHVIQETVESILLSVAQRIGQNLAKEQLQPPTIDIHIYNSSLWIQAKMIQELSNFKEEINMESLGKSYWLVEKARSYIQENYHRDLKASEVANEIHISPNYFSMIFKREFGKSFNEYLNEIRIEKAKTLLLETSDRVFEIAKEVGYKEYKYFVMIFRKVTGLTPTAFRELNIK